MIIITDLKLLPEVVMHAHSMSMDISEITINEVIQALDDEELNGDHQYRLYCWPGNDSHIEAPKEAERVMSYKDLCAEEYEFWSIEAGDVLYMYSEVTTEEGKRVVWHLVTFDSIER